MSDPVHRGAHTKTKLTWDMTLLCPDSTIPERFAAGKIGLKANCQGLYWVDFKGFMLKDSRGKIDVQCSS